MWPKFPNFHLVVEGTETNPIRILLFNVAFCQIMSFYTRKFLPRIFPPSKKEFHRDKFKAVSTLMYNITIAQCVLDTQKQNFDAKVNTLPLKTTIFK